MTPIISLTRVALGFASLALAVQAGAVNFQQSKDVVMLPANAMMAIEKNGKFAIISDTGRFIIQGTVFDVWQDKEIKTLDDARFAAQYVPVNRVKMGFSDLAPMSIGHGDKVVTMFADPACTYCKQVMDEARRDLPEGYRLDVLELPLLTERSGPRAKELLCAEDKVAAWKAGVSGDLDTPLVQKPEGACSIDIINKRRLTAQFLGARNVPFLIRDDGLTHEGKPAEGLRAWIESNRSK
ncbi:TPA: DsbC family protein [Pseudomonas aeruginosa]